MYVVITIPGRKEDSSTRCTLKEGFQRQHTAADLLDIPCSSYVIPLPAKVNQHRPFTQKWLSLQVVPCPSGGYRPKMISSCVHKLAIHRLCTTPDIASGEIGGTLLALSGLLFGPPHVCREHKPQYRM